MCIEGREYVEYKKKLIGLFIVKPLNKGKQCPRQILILIIIIFIKY